MGQKYLMATLLLILLCLSHFQQAVASTCVTLNATSLLGCTTLDLNSTSIGNDGAKALAQALRVNTNLAVLNLDGNDIGDDGAKALAQALRVNTNLTTLNLNWNSIRDDGAKALAQALRINTNLTTLNLDGNNI